MRTALLDAIALEGCESLIAYAGDETGRVLVRLWRLFPTPQCCEYGFYRREWQTLLRG